MAIAVEFEGYVNEIKTFDWGKVAKVTHQQRAKNNATGEWETVGKDYIDVTIPEGLPVPDQNTIVRVAGNLKVNLYDKTDGSKGLSMKVRAQDIRTVTRRRQSDAEAEIW